MTDTTDKLTMRAETPGVQQATDELNKLAGAMGGVAVQSEQTERSTTSLDGKFEALERRLGTTAGKQDIFAQKQELVNKFLAQSPTEVDRANEALAKLEQRYGGISPQLQKQRDQMADMAAAQERLANIQKTVNSYAGITLPGISSGRSDDIVAYGKQLDDLKAKYNPLFAAGQQYKASLADINQAAKVGALTEKERADAVLNTKIAFIQEVESLKGVSSASDVASKAIKDLGSAHGGLDAQGQAALHSIRSFGEQIALGIPPTQALTGQLNHLTFAASGEGGLSGAFGQVASLAGNLITPMRLVAGGVIGVGAAALYLGHSWSEAQTEVDRALIGIGARTGTTAADINNFAKANSSAAGLSVSQARSLAVELTKTGDVAVAGMKGVGDAIHGYAILTGKDATEATKTFAGAVSGDLVKGLLAIDERYGALNASTLEYIRTLDAQGDKTKALQVYVDAIAPANQRAAESVGFLTKTWEGLKNVFSSIVAGPAPSSIEDQIKDVQQQIASRTDSRVVQARGGTGDLSPLYKQLDDLQQKMNQFNADTAVGQLNKLSKAADGSVNAILPQIEAIRNLDKAIKSIQDAKALSDSNTPGISLPDHADDALKVYEYQRQLTKESYDNTVRQAEAVEQLKSAYGGVSSQTAVILDSLKGQLDVAQQVYGVDKMRAQELATIRDLVNQGFKPEEARMIAGQQYAIAQANATSNVLKQADSLKDQAAMIRAQQAGTEASVAAAIAYKNAINAGADEWAAAEVRAATLSVYTAKAAADMERAAEASQKFNENAENAERALNNAAGGNFGSQGSSAFGGFDVPKGNGQTSTSNVGYQISMILPYLQSQAEQTAQSVAEKSLSFYGLDSAISATRGLHDNTTTNIAGPGLAQYGINLPGHVSESDILSNVQTLYDLKNSQTNDNSVKVQNLNEELAWLQGRPETIARDQAIANLMQSIKQLTDATNSNTAATAASLNPLYSGRGALHIGYYKAANGLDGVAQGGIPGVDSVPIHIMAMPGEPIKVGAPAMAAGSAAPNDNRRTVINNITIPSAPTSNARRSQRQWAQGFGQIAAASS